MFIVRSPCLACRRPPDIGISAGAPGNNFFQDGGEAVNRIFTDYLFVFRFCGMVFEDISIPVHHFEDGNRFYQLAVIGKYAVGFGHIVDGYAVGETADGSCQVVIGGFPVFDKGGNTAGFGQFQDFSHAHFIGQVDGGDVHGMNEGFFQGDFAAGSAAVVLRGPAAGISLLFIAYRIVGAEFIFKSGDIDERLEGGARLTDHLDRAVEVVFAAAAYHGFDMAGTHFDGEEGALGLSESLIVFGALRKIGFESFFCFFLHVQVQGGVHLESFFVDGI